MTSGWEKVSTIALGLLVLEGALALSAAGLSAFRSPSSAELPAYCNATVNDFTCSFTNTSDSRVRGQCVSGKLLPAPGSSGKPVESNVACSGAIGPRETKVVAVSLKGRATEACKGADGLLDFQQCQLDTNAVP